MLNVRFTFALGAIAFACCANAQTTMYNQFQLGIWPASVSQDGTILVGTDSNNRPAYYANGHLLELPARCASVGPMSRDGHIVGGQTTDKLPYLWSPSAGLTILPLPAGETIGGVGMISGDGKVAVGSAGYGFTPLVWDSTGVHKLPKEDPTYYNLITCINYDGSMFGGSAGLYGGYDWFNFGFGGGYNSVTPLLYSKGPSGYTYSNPAFDNMPKPYGDLCEQIACMTDAGAYYTDAFTLDHIPGSNGQYIQANFGGVDAFYHSDGHPAVPIGVDKHMEIFACTSDGLAAFGRVFHAVNYPPGVMYSTFARGEALISYRGKVQNLFTFMAAHGIDLGIIGAVWEHTNIYRCSGDGSVLIGDGDFLDSHGFLNHGLGFMIRVVGNLRGLALQPNSVRGGDDGVGYVALDWPSGGGMYVKLNSDNPAVVPNGNYFLSDGENPAVFQYHTNAVSQDTLVHVSLVLNGKGTTIPLMVTQDRKPSPSLASVTTQFISAGKASGKVSFSSPVPAPGATVLITSGNEGAALPQATVFVPAGATSATFPIDTYPVAYSTVVTIRADYNTQFVRGMLLVNPANPYSLTVTPNPVPGGNQVSVKLIFAGYAPFQMQGVLKSSNNSIISTGTGLPLSSNGQTLMFPLAAKGVDDDSQVTLSAVYPGATAATTVKVLAATVKSITPANSTIPVGTSENILVTLNGSCGPSGGTLTLVSANPAAVSVPSTASLSAGKVLSGFKVTGKAHTAAPVPITIGYRGLTYHIYVSVQ